MEVSVTMKPSRRKTTLATVVTRTNLYGRDGRTKKYRRLDGITRSVLLVLSFLREWGLETDQGWKQKKVALYVNGSICHGLQAVP